MSLLPHLRTSSSTLFSAIRSSNNTLRTPLNKRFFTPSASNMVINTYFDVSWTGPVIQVDQKGDITSTGEVKGKLLPLASSYCSVFVSPSYGGYSHHLSVIQAFLDQLLTLCASQTRPAASTSSSSTRPCPRLLRTSALSALARKASDTRAPNSTVSFPSSCSRVVTLPVAT
jgi:hypothetical protein